MYHQDADYYVGEDTTATSSTESNRQNTNINLRPNGGNGNNSAKLNGAATAVPPSSTSHSTTVSPTANTSTKVNGGWTHLNGNFQRDKQHPGPGRKAFPNLPTEPNKLGKFPNWGINADHNPAMVRYKVSK